jgi:hypothetical protein
MTGAQAGQEILRLARKLEKGVLKAELESQAELLKEVTDLSSGTEGPEETRGRYAIRNNPGLITSYAQINEQTGDFVGRWTAPPTLRTATGISHLVVNTSPIGQFLVKGTRTMIARPIDQIARDRIANERRERIIAAIREALK